MDFTLNLTRTLQAKRDLLAQASSTRLGFERLPCEGTYFLTAGIGALTNEPRRVFCERLVREAGVALIPSQRLLRGRASRTISCGSPSARSTR